MAGSCSSMDEATDSPQHSQSPVDGADAAAAAAAATPQPTHAAPTAGQLPLVDVQRVADKLKKARCQHRLAYMQHLEARCPLDKLAPAGGMWPPSVQPSLLKAKLCAGGSNRLSSTLRTMPTADGLAVLDQPPLADLHGGSSSKDHAAAWQFGLTLLHATHVGPCGLPPTEQPLRHVARCCIFDRARHRFLGNVHSWPVTSARAHRGLGALGSCWSWDSSGPAAGPGAAAGGSLTDVCHQQAPRLALVPPGQLAGSLDPDSASVAECVLGATAAAAAASGAAAAAAAGQVLADALTAASTAAHAGRGGHNTAVVRCAGVGDDPVSGLRQLEGERLSILVELNVAARLTAADAAVVPQDEALGAGLVDEVTTCWALISLRRCAELGREMTISVPLYAGSIYEPVLLSEVWAERRRQQPLRSMLSATPNPQLTFRAGPLPVRQQTLLPYRLMPATMIARRDTACLLAAARLALAAHLQQAASDAPWAVSHACTPIAAAAAAGGDAVLAALPRLLDDEVLLRELMAKWDARVRGLRQAAEDGAAGDALAGCLAGPAGCALLGTAPPRPTPAQLLAALRTSVLELAPLLHSASLPPPHIGNLAEHQAHRAAVAAMFCRWGSGDGGAAFACGGASMTFARHPVDVLSRRPDGMVHESFDVAETRVCVAQALARSRWARC